jgi:serine/threonine-protein kinase HipA
VWRFAPAYDLVFSEDPAGQNTMAVAGEAVDPGKAGLMRVADEGEVDAGRG